MSGPIKPGDVQKHKNVLLPEEVFKAFNELIVENWTGTSATFLEEVVAKRIASFLDLPVGEVYTRRYLDVENAYLKAGWGVEYDHPGYNEFYKTNFKFFKKRSK
jgi:hypothetical protein